MDLDINLLINLSYIAASIIFVVSLKLLSSPKTATKANFLSAIAMLISVVATLFSDEIAVYQWIIVGAIPGILLGMLVAKKVPMTQMPEVVALFNGSGGAASFLVGWAEYNETWAMMSMTSYSLLAVVLATLIGCITFTGSLMAYGKLSGKITAKSIMFPGQHYVNFILFAAIATLSVVFCMKTLAPPLINYQMFMLIIGISMLIGITSVLPIGGADMPIVISLLNSYSGLAACAAGFVIINNVLIVVGALVGASGIILTKIMCKSMNRSLANVLFSGFGSAAGTKSNTSVGEVKSLTVEDAYYILEAAGSVLFVPGYGMAVAQAQHAVKELADYLENNGSEVQYAIHPVAGRMPGHMNVLLAEANVPYEQLVEPDDVNPNMEMVDVCVIIGANDVVNPAARDDDSSPIYGMPVIEADRAKTTIVLKRSMNTGFAGLDNPLFTKETTRMLFGDGKETVSALIGQFKD